MIEVLIYTICTQATFFLFIWSLRVMYITQADQVDSSVHKLKSFTNTTCSSTLTLFAFHINKKHYLDTFHKQNKTVMHIRMHNYDFDILLRSVHFSAKLQIANIHKNAPKIKCYLCKASWVFEFSYKFCLAQNLQLWVPLAQFHLSRWTYIEPGTHNMCRVIFVSQGFDPLPSSPPRGRGEKRIGTLASEDGVECM